MENLVKFVQSGNTFTSKPCSNAEARELVKTLKSKGLNNTFSEHIYPSTANAKPSERDKPSPNSFTSRTREPMT